MRIDYHENSIRTDSLKPDGPHHESRHDASLDVERVVGYFVQVRCIDHIRMQNERVGYFREHSGDRSGVPSVAADLRADARRHQQHNIEILRVLSSPIPEMKDGIDRPAARLRQAAYRAKLALETRYRAF